MPQINQHQTIDISPQKFLDACSDMELIELDLLLGTNRYQLRIKAASAPNNTQDVNFEEVKPNQLNP